MEGTNLNGVKRSSSTLGMELYSPDLFARLASGLDTLYRRVVTVDEEWFPSLWEGFLQLQSILMVLTKKIAPIMLACHPPKSQVAYLVT